MLAEIAITPELVMTILGVLCTLITTGIAVWKHIKAKNWEAAASEIAKTVDKLKGLTPAQKRQPLLRDLGERLGNKKSMLDQKLENLGLDTKS